MLGSLVFFVFFFRGEGGGGGGGGSLQKHAYSNVLKILPPKMKKKNSDKKF